MMAHVSRRHRVQPRDPAPSARRIRRAGVGAWVLVPLLVLGCGIGLPASTDPGEAGPPAARPAASTSVPAPTTSAATPSRAGAALAATAAAASSRPGVELGVAVLDLATGEVVTNDRGDAAYNSASLVKMITVTDMLDGRASGRTRIDESDLARVRRALGPSDDAAMNLLWTDFDGPAGVTRVSRRLGLSDTTAPADPSQWGQVQVSARDMAQVFRYAVQGLAPADRDLVLSALRAAPATAADGFDQAFGLLDPATRGATAAKQGWLCCLSSSIDLHSVGLLDPDGRYVLALLSNQPLGYEPGRAVLDRAAGAARTAVAG